MLWPAMTYVHAGIDRWLCCMPHSQNDYKKGQNKAFACIEVSKLPVEANGPKSIVDQGLSSVRTKCE